MWTSPATELGAFSQVAQPDATTDGAAGAAGAVTGTMGRLAAAPPVPMSHPVRPAITMAVVMRASCRIRSCLRALDVTLLGTLDHARLPSLAVRFGQTPRRDARHDRIRDKTDCRRRADLTCLALQTGLI